ncbi:MAG TPA: hypothetical protein VK906_12710 [Egicoccus sp.]|nr:hypothetical protein [Egicoccus sp.]HSK24037.1 hypothetical protein [Egicoccus sp.]
MSDQDRPLTPDEIEQQRRADGSLDGYETVEEARTEVPDHPLTPDEIEQSQVVEYDEDDQPAE